ncbi:Multidrug resistance-associated protein 1 [Mortierella sp. NVP41]|nr:Multidrug resistance-associated protein 1 [Mortierella sp. NVP41]
MASTGLMALVHAVFDLQTESTSMASAFGHLCFSVAWCTAVVLNRQEHKHTIRSADGIFSFYLWSILALSLVIRTLIDLQQTAGPQFVLTVAMTICLLLGLIVEAWPRGSTRVQQMSDASPYDKANMLSRMMVYYIQPIVSLAVKRTITPEDIENQMPAWMSEKSGVERFETQWRKNVANSSSPSLIRTVFRVQARSIAPMYVLKVIQAFLMFTVPVLLGLLLESFQEVYSGGQTKSNLVYGLVLAIAMFVAAFVGAIMKSVTRLSLIMQSLQTKVALTGMIYKKALRLSPGARNKSTTGEIVNHMSVDADVWQDGLFKMSNWVSLPIEISAAMWLLYRLLGWSSLAGIVALLAIAPLQVWRARVYNRMLNDKLSVMDERVRLTTEILAAIKVVKLYGWESAFKQKILEVRDRELGALKRLGVIFAIMSIVFTSSTLIMSLLTLSVYALWGGEGLSRGELTPQTVFVSMTLFGMLRTPIGELSETVSDTISVIVGSNRVERFLLLEEVDESSVLRDPEVPMDPSLPLVSIEDGTFSWTKQSCASEVQDQQHVEDDSSRPLLSLSPSTNTQEPASTARCWQPTLKHVRLSMDNGSLTAVVGRVGQGKSSLLSAILGEMYTLQGRVSTRGRIAYVPQHAWILNASVKDNILFGQPYEEARYLQILYAAGLEPDLAILPAGDLTEIGERGINLSGGQKQRMSLARAAYANVDIYLLDDPLSAVDAHVDRHLWKHLLGPEGMLKDKTRILVTHGIHHLREVDSIVLVKDGEVAENGTYPELMARRDVFYQLIKDYSVGHRKATRGENGDSTGATLTDTTGTGSILPGSDSPTNGQVEESGSGSGLGDEDGSSLAATVELPEDAVGLNSNDKTTASDGKLIEAEKIKEGTVDFTVSLAYVRAATYKLAGLVVLFHIISQMCLVGTNLWLKYWIQNDDSNVIIDYGPSAPSLLMIGGEEEGSSLKVFVGVFSALTVLLPWAIDDMLYFGIRLTSSIIVISVSTPVFLVALPIFVAAVTVIQKYYLASSRAIKRIFHVSKSPVFQHFNETLGGVTTIRAMRLQDRFQTGNAELLLTHVNAHVAYSYCIRWVEVRLQALSAVVILVVAVGFVLSAGKDMDPATAGLALSFTLSITQEVNYLVRSYCETQNLLVSVERMCEYTDMETEAPETLPLDPRYYS